MLAKITLHCILKGSNNIGLYFEELVLGPFLNKVFDFAILQE